MTTKTNSPIIVLLCILLALICISMTVVMHSSFPDHPQFRNAVVGTASMVAFIPLFVLARFSFGYLVGIAFYVLITGFTWFSYFSLSEYDHGVARWSAAASLLLILWPLLFQTWPLRHPFRLAPKVMDRFLVALLVFAAAILAWSASYGFAFVGTGEAEQLRSAFSRPTVLNYITGSLIGAVLPFAFGYLAEQRKYGLAALSVVLIAAFYPVVLNKTVAFAAVWLPFLYLMFRIFPPRQATIYAIMLPMAAGLLLYALAPQEGRLGAYALGTINIRMFAYPSMALDRYSDFFFSHELTHFCQVQFIRAIRGCPYAFQLGAEMSTRYHMGNLNGSLFATEGVASVGPYWAPLSALFCGLLLSLGNSLSARLSPAVIAASSGLVVQALSNVPLSASLLSNGLFVLLALWFIAPEPAAPQHAEAHAA